MQPTTSTNHNHFADAEEFARYAGVIKPAVAPDSFAAAQRTLWDSTKERTATGDKFDFQLRIKTGGLYILSTIDMRTTLRTTIRIAHDIASKQFSGVAGDSALGELCLFENCQLGRIPQDKTVNPNVLYLNTMHSEERLSLELADTVRGLGSTGPMRDSLPDSLIVVSMAPGETVKRVRAIRSFLYEHNIHVLVLNSFDFAYMTHRQKSELVGILHQLRDEFKLTVIVATYEALPKMDANSLRGPIGKLVQASSAAIYIGDADSRQHPLESDLDYAIRKPQTGPVRGKSLNTLIKMGEMLAAAIELESLDAEEQRREDRVRPNRLPDSERSGRPELSGRMIGPKLGQKAEAAKTAQILEAVC